MLSQAAWRLATTAGLLWAAAPLEAGAGDGALEGLSFARDVRPILSDRCFACHGPDGEARKAGLRLDTFEGATAELKGGRRALVPGDPDSSALLERVLEHDPAQRMPPAETGKLVTPEEAELLGRWIAQGASYERHWAFVPPVRPEPPVVREGAWPRGELDRFVLARLEAEGLAPSPEAARQTLLRRVTLDLTGLPPSLEELDAFLADDSPDAYERAVEGLLASPRYGEHMARYWLDAARYGDTHGLHLDNQRNLWRWRDWVIEAINRNLPYDRFVVEQLAGDLLPDATLETRIASGFNRNNPTTGEGGLIAEEFLAKYAMDRTDTFGTVFLGLTVHCAQCHDHKYDPLPQREYYGLLAYFDSLAEAGSDENALAPPPSLRAPTPLLAAELERAAEAVRVARERLERPIPELDAAQQRWELAQRAALAARWRVLEPGGAAARGGASLTVLEDGSLLASGANPETDVYELDLETELEAIGALRLEALTHPSLPRGGPGRAYNSNFVLTGVELLAGPRGGEAPLVRVPLVRARADHSQKDFDVSGALDGAPATGWAASARPEDRTATFHPPEPFGHAGGTHLRVRLAFESRYAQHALGRLRLAVSADPSLVPASATPWRLVGPLRAASGDEAFATDWIDPGRVRFDAPVLGAQGAAELRWTARTDLVDGAVHTLSEAEFASVYLARTIRSPTERELTLSLGSDDSIRVWLNGDALLAKRVARPAAPDQERVTLPLRAGENLLLLEIVNDRGGFAFYYRVADEELGGLDFELERVLTLAHGAPDATQRARLRDHYRRRHWLAWPVAAEELAQREAELRSLEERAPLTMVSRELDERRATRVLLRGQYDQPGDPVDPGVPSALHPLPADAPPNRLGLARWVVDPANPLTARVTVNAHWQRFFGTGLVATPEDFGAQGAFPTHPELLDWLAVELVESGWDLKGLHRRIVNSATYRQDARRRAEAAGRDPGVRLLGRAPRLRLDAEALRDSALFAAGLLVEELGGPSVKPPQPPGLWEAVAYPSSNTARFVQDQGDALYRRSLYSFWKRTSPPPLLAILDAPNREFCVVERARTNTPLQALALLNEVQLVEAARALAERVLRERDLASEQRLTRAFRLTTSRTPDGAELEILGRALADLRAHFHADPAAARALIGVGDSVADATLDPLELAAWTALANLLLNLDETLTRG